jgi:hypothetical protein
MSPPGCGLDHPAFCEGFETPAPGGRGGDIDETKWAFSRWGIGGQYVNFVKTTSYGLLPPTWTGAGLATPINTISFCGQPVPATGIDLPNDVKFCNGIDGAGNASKQLHEILNDDGGFGVQEMMIRQPFDFTERTGTIVFDVDAKHNNNFSGATGHGWWLEVWITADPAPIPYHGDPTIGSYPRDGLGLQIIPVGCGFSDGKNEINHIVISQNYKVVRDQNGVHNLGCFNAVDNKLNRFKIQISKTKLDVFATDYDNPTKMKQTFTSAVALDFTVGYIHFQHAQYNAFKNGFEKAGTGMPVDAKSASTPAQTYRWDNIGFDGLVYPMPRAYDIPDEMSDIKCGTAHCGVSTGYGAKALKSFTLSGVSKADATSAKFSFGLANAKAGAILQYQFNGKGWHTFTVPSTLGSAELLMTFSESVPLEELVDGNNMLEVKGAPDRIGDMDLTLQTSK